MSLKTVDWYYHRLKAMSVPELFYRFRTLAVNQTEKHFTNTFTRAKNFSFPSREDFFARLFSSLDNRSEILITYKKDFRKAFEDSITAANRLLERRFQIFDCQEIEFNGRIDWHRDFKTGKSWPHHFHASINVYDTKMGGCKYVWELNRHYHLVTLAKAYYLSGEEKYAKEVCWQIKSWVSDNPPFLGINWYSALELAIRLISWTWVVGFVWESKSFDKKLQSLILQSLFLQASFISRHLSKYSSANNHLIGEAAGLFVISTVFTEFRESKKWQYKAIRVLEEEAFKQINPDGTPGEQTTEYLLFILDFYFLVIRLANKNKLSLSTTLLQRIQKACHFLEQLQDSAGNIPHLGDSDDGRASYLSEGFSHRSFVGNATAVFDPGSGCGVADEYGFWLLGAKLSKVLESKIAKKGGGSQLFETGGIAVLRNEKITLYCDCGPLGYGSMAAHGHADALSFVLTVEGLPIFIDPGTYLYHNVVEWRDYFRGTSAHNTIRIDRQDQAVPAGTFIWSKHFNCQILSFESNDKTDTLVAEHDGYARLNDPLVHRRSTFFDKSKNEITIDDFLDCKREHFVEQFFHFSPECEVTQKDTMTWQISRGSVSVVLVCKEDCRTEVLNGESNPPLGWFSRGFGQKEPTNVLRKSGEIFGASSLTTIIKIKR